MSEMYIFGPGKTSLTDTTRNVALRDTGPADIFTWSIDLEGLQELSGCLGAKRRIRVLASRDGATPGVVSLSGSLGMELRFYSEKTLCHAKAFVFRTTRDGLIGSFNVAYKSFRKNIEFGAEISRGESERLGDLFDQLWSVSDKLEDSDLESTPTPKADEPTRPPVDPVPPEPDDAGGVSPLLGDQLPPEDYQEAIIREVVGWVTQQLSGDTYERQGRLIQLPTGAGKTLIAVETVRRLLQADPDTRILWVTHRRELLLQAFQRLVAQCGAQPGAYYFYDSSQLRLIEETGPALINRRLLARESEDAHVAFCTNQSLWDVDRDWDLVIVDEAHRFHADATTYAEFQRALNRRGCAVRIGLTATPLEGDDRKFGNYWELDESYGREVRVGWLIENGYRARVDERSKRWPTGFQFLLNSGGDADAEILEQVSAFNNDQVNDAACLALDEFRSKCRRILVFAVTIEHAEVLTRRFGSVARVLHSKRPEAELRNTLNWFREDPAAAPDVRVLVTVLMAAEGVDFPKVDCLFLLRPTFSDLLHQQMVGRGLRGPKVKGTETCVLVDFVHQFITKDGKEWTQVTFENPLDEGPTSSAPAPTSRVLSTSPPTVSAPAIRRLPREGYRLRNVLDRFEATGSLSWDDLAAGYEATPQTIYNYLSRSDEVPDRFYQFVKTYLTARGLYR